jgi:hypothetical protein
MATPALPRHWELLSRDDQAKYLTLQQSLATPSGKNRRNRSVETFPQTLETIKSFVNRNDGDDWKRSLVCGVCWLNSEGTVAVNIRQLRVLVSKCKSSINGSFQLLGFSLVSAGTECSGSIGRCLPVLHDNFQELRQWTVRKNAATDTSGHHCPPSCISPAPESDAVVGVYGSELRVDIEVCSSVFSENIQSPSETIFENLYEINIFDDPLSFSPRDMEVKYEELSYFKFDETDDPRKMPCEGF